MVPEAAGRRDTQKLRDDFMGIVVKHLPQLSSPEPERRKRLDGSTTYLDTLNGYSADAQVR